MQKTATKARASSSYTRPTLQKSTTLSRKYVRRPGVAKKVSDVSAKAAVAPKTTGAAPKTTGAAPKTTGAAPKKATKIAINADKEPKVAFKTRAKAGELSGAIASSAKKTPIKAEKVERSAAIRRFGEPASVRKVAAPVSATSVAKKKVAPEKKAAPVAKKATSTSVAKKKVASSSVVKPTAAERKAAVADAAREAMRGVATMNAGKTMKSSRGRRFALAFGCSAIVVAILAVFVAVNMPNISVKIASAQTGIEASYPSVVPRNYSLETVASDKSGKITMKFVGPEEASFILTEEKSTWDSTAVLNNYVKTTYSANYATMHEQGITYYSESGSAAWVNGGILYKVTSYGKNLSREQIRNLVVSL